MAKPGSCAIAGDWTRDRIDTPSAAVLALWGKQYKSQPDLPLPLLHHLLAAAAAAGTLWDELLPPAAQCLLAELAESSVTEVRSWAIWLAALHDLGKATPGFQRRVPSARCRLQAAGLPFPPGATPSHLLPGYRLVRELMAHPPGLCPPLDAPTATAVASLTAGHHGPLLSACQPPCGERDRGGPAWDRLRGELIAHLAAACQADDLRPLPGLHGRHHPLLALLGGVVRLADWLASAYAAKMPPPASPLSPTDYLHACGEALRLPVRRLARRLTAETPTPPGSPGPAPNALQQAVTAWGRQVAAPALAIIEAPTGSGKTAAALQLADLWGASGAAGGLHFALPTRAAAGAMWLRLAALSPDPRQLSEAHGGQPADRETSAPIPLAALWAPQVVATTDQSLLAVLPTGMNLVRLLTLAGKTVVLDEVHALDAHARSLLGRLLQWLAAFRCPVIVLSATLPATVRNDLLTAYGGHPVASPSPPYPRLSWAGPAGSGAHSLPSPPERRVTLRRLPRRPADCLAELTEALTGGGEAAWVCSTIGQAQGLYAALQPALAALGMTVELLHSRFPLATLRRRQQRLLHRRGPEGATEPQGRLLIATQIIEQSLDLDFDLLISDPAPLTSLLQRLGRLHRHSRPRPAALAGPQLWLVTSSPGEGGHSPAAQVYPGYLLQRADEVLAGCAELNLPADSERLLAAADDQIAAASPAFALRPPDYRGALSDPPPVAGWRRVATRQSGGPSAEVVCVYGSPEAFALQPGQPPCLSADEEPTPAQAAALQEQRLTVRGQVAGELFNPLPTPPAWRQQASLRRLCPLYLNRFGEVRLGSWTLRLDDQLGLVICPLAERGPGCATLL
jgi:CRISPR-associated endonuclease/helicase Cas3